MIMFNIAALKVIGKIPNVRNVCTGKKGLSIAYFGSDQFSVRSLKN